MKIELKADFKDKPKGFGKGKTTNRVRQAKYIEAHLACGGIRREAAKAADVPLDSVYRWFNKDPKFIALLREAEHELAQALVLSGTKRALAKSDTLTIFFLKAQYPEVYDDAIRRLAWMKANGIEDPDRAPPTTIIIERGPDRPSAIKATNDSNGSYSEADTRLGL